MKRLCIKSLIIMLLCFSGFYYPAAAQDLRNSAGSYSQYTQGNSAQRGGGISEAPPGGGDQNSGISPIGSGFTILIGLSFCYLFYIVLKKTKKEEK